MGQPVKLRDDVQITPLESGHAAEMYRWMTDPEVSSNVGLRRTPSLDATLDWIATAAGDPEVLALAILQGGRHVGNVVFDQLDRHLGKIRLSVYIGETSARGLGVASTSIYLGMARAFGRPEVQKIWLTVHEQNEAAIRTYRRLGFEIEGVLRNEFKLDGVAVNAVYMGLLRREFEAISVVR